MPTVIEPSSRVHRCYDAAWRLATPVARLTLRLRGGPEPDSDRGARERLGRLPSLAHAPNAASIWFHAASVGEVRSLEPILQRLREARPDAIFTCTLATSSRAAFQATERLLGPLRVRVAAAPLDAPSAIDGMWNHLRPSLLVVCECELWPNLFHRVAARGTRVAMVNARVYPRDVSTYERVARWFRPALRGVAWIGAASRSDAERLEAAGLPPARIEVIGSSKFDQADVDLDASPRTLGSIFDGGDWIALASLHPGEAGPLLEALAPALAARTRLRVLVAPRHARGVRGALTAARRLRLTTELRSAGIDSNARVLVLDTLGELASMLPRMSATLLGGSFVPAGGHNPIEAAVAGSPAVIGPSHENFQTIIDAFREASAIRVTRDPREAIAALLEFVDDPPSREAAAHRAREVVRAARGASDRYATRLLELLEQVA